MQKVKNNQFKAKSFNQKVLFRFTILIVINKLIIKIYWIIFFFKILECSDLGLPKLQKIEPTVPESPAITKPVDNENSVIFLDDLNNNLQEHLDQNHDELGNAHLFKTQ